MLLRTLEKIGWFRLFFIPLGLAIIVSAISNQILGMGLVGLVVLIFGILNKCIMFGNCDIDKPKTNSQKID